MKIRILAALLPTFFFSSTVWAAPIGGTVVDEAKKPVANARVFFSSIVPRAQKSELLQTRSDAEGKWTLDVPDAPANARGWTYRRIVIIAPGFGWKALLSNSKDAKPLDVMLQAGTSVSGVVQDAEGKPIAGVRVTPGGATVGEDYENSVQFGQNLAQEFSVQSGEDGTFSFDGVPLDATVYAFIKDPRFATTYAQSKAGAVLTLKALPTPKISGRVVGPDGAPRAGIEVTASGFGEDAAVLTDAQGRYTLAPVPVENGVQVQFRDPKNELLAPTQQVPKLAPGEEKTLADVQLSRGVLVTGRVVDEDEKPVVGASLYSQSEEQLTTDKDGKFQMRVAPGRGYLSISSETHVHPGDGGGGRQLNVPKDQETFDLGDIKMVRGGFIEGTARAEDGSIPKGARLSYERGWGANGTVDDEGKFKIGPLRPGAVSLKSSGEWDIAGESKFTLPKGGGTVPATLTLRKVTLASATGRVVDAKGAPVANAKLQITVFLDKERNSRTFRQVSSDNNGDFTVDKLRPEQAVAFGKIEGDEFAVLETGEAVKGANGWSLGEIIVARQDAVVTGQIVGADGQPVANALVVATGKWTPNFATTDATGNFKLEKLPAGTVEIVAAHGEEFARQSVDASAPAPLALKLASSTKPTREAIFKMLDGAKERQYHLSSSLLGAMDAPTALEISVRADGVALETAEGAAKPKAGRNLASMLQNLAKRDPAQASTWGVEQFERFEWEPNARVSVGAALALSALKTRPDWTKSWFERERAAQPLNDLSAEAADRYFQLAGIAGALGLPDADDLLDLGLTVADAAVKGKAREEKANTWGASIARGGTPLVMKLIEEWPAATRIKALGGAVSSTAPFDAASAQTLFEALQAARKDPEIVKADAAIENSEEPWREENSKRSEESARRALVAGWATVDAAKMMSVAEGFDQEYYKQAALLTAAARQIDAKQFDEATKSLRAAKLGENYGGDESRLAGLAARYNRPFADEIFLATEKKLTAADNRFGDDNYRAGLSGLAWHLAPLDPARARLLLENEWVWRRTKAAAEKEAEYSQHGQEMGQIAASMGALDLVRAQEMFEALPKKNNQSGWYRGMMVAALLARTPLERVSPFHSWDGE